MTDPSSRRFDAQSVELGSLSTVVVSDSSWDGPVCTVENPFKAVSELAWNRRVEGSETLF